MKYVFQFILIQSIFASFNTSKKGLQGEYYIAGKAYDSKRQLIMDKKIIMQHGKNKDTITTDINGNYEIKVKWRSACASGISIAEQIIRNKKLNPKWIYLILTNKTTQIENVWERYIELNYKSKAEKTYHLDITL